MRTPKIAAATPEPADARTTPGPSATLTTPTRPTRPRSLALDLMRILAALWVVVVHWGKGVEGAGDVPTVVSLGILGVDVFFILSGAVVIHTALNRSWSDFARRRFLRVFPVYLLATLAMIVWGVVKGQAAFEPSDLNQLSGLALWTGPAPIISVAWTLFYEVSFYILVALLILVRGRLDEKAAMRGVQAFLVLSLIAAMYSEPLLDFLTLAPYGPYFALGAAVGICSTAADVRRSLPTILVAAFLSYGVLADRIAVFVPSPGSTAVWALGVLSLALVFLVWDRVFHKQSRVGVRVRESIVVLSLMTYPIYLLHQDFGVRLVNVFAVRGVAHSVAFAVSGAVLLAVTWAVVRFFEPLARAVIRRMFAWNAN